MIYKTKEADVNKRDIDIKKLYKETKKMCKMIDGLIDGFNGASMEFHEKMVNMKEYNVTIVNDMSNSIKNNEELLRKIQDGIKDIHSNESFNLQDIIECSRSMSTEDQHRSTCEDVSRLLIKKNSYLDYLLSCVNNIVSSIDFVNSCHNNINAALYDKSSVVEDYAATINKMFIDYIDGSKRIVDKLHEINSFIESNYNKIIDENESLKIESNKVIESKNVEILHLKKNSIILDEKLQNVETEYIKSQSKNQALNESINDLNKSINDLRDQLKVEKDRSCSLLNELNESKIQLNKSIESQDRCNDLMFNYVDGTKMHNMISNINQENMTDNHDDSFDFCDMANGIKIIAGCGIEDFTPIKNEKENAHRSISEDLGDDVAHFDCVEPLISDTDKFVSIVNTTNKVSVNKAVSKDSVFRNNEKMLNSACMEINVSDSSESESIVSLGANKINHDIEVKMMNIIESVVSNFINIDDQNGMSSEFNDFILTKKVAIDNLHKQYEDLVASKDLIVLELNEFRRNNEILNNKIVEMRSQFDVNKYDCNSDNNNLLKSSNDLPNRKISCVSTQVDIEKCDACVNTNDILLSIDNDILNVNILPEDKGNYVCICKAKLKVENGMYKYKNFHSLDDLFDTSQKLDTISIPDKIKHSRNMRRRYSFIKNNNTFDDVELNDHIPQVEVIRRKKLNFLTDNDYLDKIEDVDELIKPLPCFRNVVESEVNNVVSAENISQTPQDAVQLNSTLDSSNVELYNITSSPYVMGGLVIFVIISAAIHAIMERYYDEGNNKNYDDISYKRKYQNDYVKVK